MRRHFEILLDINLRLLALQIFLHALIRKETTGQCDKYGKCQQVAFLS